MDEQRMTDYYREAMQTSSAQEPLRRYLSSPVHQTPSLRFLEIGAGTGGTTTEIFRTIADPDTGIAFEHYTYTDISPSFFDRARETFQYPNRMTSKCSISRKIQQLKDSMRARMM